jgi:hypothetical protein
MRFLPTLNLIEVPGMLILYYLSENQLQARVMGLAFFSALGSSAIEIVRNI